MKSRLFTEQQDLNGKDIYADDIVKTPTQRYPLMLDVVSFVDGRFVLRGEIPLKGELVEVVGNIHENPEFYR